MKVYIIGGFLGSGKTTLLLKIASMCSKRGLKTALVINEAGEIGVDGATVRAEGYNAVELPEGCICCTLAGTLQVALRNIVRDMDPEVIIIEPTGLALSHKVRDLVHTAMIDEDECSIIGIVDVERFPALIEKKEAFFKMQMSGSDIVLVNKIDLAKPGDIEVVESWFANEFPSKQLIRVSAKTGENLDRVFEMM